MSEIIVQLNGASVSKNIFDFQNISENILNRYPKPLYFKFLDD